MTVVELQQRIPAPRERVFAALTDHAAFGRLVGAPITVERPGAPDANGLGAVRAVRIGGMTIREQVVTWDPPAVMEYRVLGGGPLRDHLGRLELTVDGEGTRVDYRIRFRIPWYWGGALVGEILRRLLAQRIGAGLGRLPATLG